MLEQPGSSAEHSPLAPGAQNGAASTTDLGLPTPVVEMPLALSERDTSLLAPTQAGPAAGVAELEELASRDPNDVGVHLVLASVYARQGNPEAALHVYRRVAKRRGLPAFLVQVIYEDLNYLESEIKPHPRLHLVRGDLLIGEGRYREAMEEYNKMTQLAARR